MLKNILKLQGAHKLGKSEQISVKGGGRIGPGGCASSNWCSSVCSSGSSGHICDIHCDCPNTNDGMCDGNGGYYLL